MSLSTSVENHDKALPTPVTAAMRMEEQDDKTAFQETIEALVGKVEEDKHHLHPNHYYGNSILRVPSPDTLSELSLDDNGLFRSRRNSIALQPLGRIASRSPGPGSRRTWTGKLDAFWIKNKGLGLVLLAQIFGVLMNVTTRYEQAVLLYSSVRKIV
jgi:hypothetical protein